MEVSLLIASNSLRRTAALRSKLSSSFTTTSGVTVLATARTAAQVKYARNNLSCMVS
jgi:hypothetical protein